MASRTEASSNPLHNLHVTIRQTSSITLLRLTVAVQNKNTHPVTIPPYQSPFDPALLTLGHLSVTPDGQDTPLEYPVVKFRRKWPPAYESLVEIGTREIKENEIEVVKPIPMEKLGDKATVKLSGRWMSVLSVSKKDVKWSSDSDGDGDGLARFSGDWESNSIEIIIDGYHNDINGGSR